MAGPFTVSPGPDNAMYFSEITAGKIGRIDLTTKKVTEQAVPTLASAPGDIACDRGLHPTDPQSGPCDPNGSLYFTEVGGDKVGTYTP